MKNHGQMTFTVDHQRVYDIKGNEGVFSRTFKYINVMKSVLYTVVLFSIFSFRTNAQTLEWLNVFDVHSFGIGSGISPNSLVDNNGKIVTQVIENDTIKLYQTAADGTIINTYDSGKMNHFHYTPLIRVGQDEQAFVYESLPYPGLFWLLQTDDELNVTKEVQLEFPQEISFPNIENLIEYNNTFYLTATSNENHHLFRINEDDSLLEIYSGSLDVAFGEDYILLDNGNVIFSYKDGAYGNGQIIRCFSLDDEELIWEQTIDAGVYNLLSEYKVVNHGNTLYAVGKEVEWIDGVLHSQISISHVNADSGEILFQEPLVCDNCFGTIVDFAYNGINDHIYINLVTDNISLIEIDNQSADIINQQSFTYDVNSTLPTIGEKSHIHIMENGQVVFIYKNYKDEIEQDNLYIVLLDNELNPVGEELEINLDTHNSNETPTDILQYDQNKILITGISPDPDPFIFWEKVRYFTAMIDFEDILSLENQTEITDTVILYPNPVKSELFIQSDKKIESILVFDYSGKKVLSIKDSAINKVDVSGLNQGIYIALMKDTEGNRHWSRFIKQ